MSWSRRGGRWRGGRALYDRSGTAVLVLLGITQVVALLLLVLT